MWGRVTGDTMLEEEPLRERMNIPVVTAGAGAPEGGRLWSRSLVPLKW